MLCLGETCVGKNLAATSLELGQTATTTQTSTSDFYDASQYDASGYAVAPKTGTETVQRWMSKAELDATQSTGLLRGGRGGTHHATDAANSSAQRARQRLALGETPEVRVTMEVPAGRFSTPSRVDPLNGMPGGGMERTATGNIPAIIKRVDGMP